MNGECFRHLLAYFKCGWAYFGIGGDATGSLGVDITGYPEFESRYSIRIQNAKTQKIIKKKNVTGRIRIILNNKSIARKNNIIGIIKTIFSLLVV